MSEWVNLYTAHYKQKVASAPQSRQTNAFRSRLNCTNSVFGFRSVVGRLFHTFGPATENLPSPNRV